MIKVTSEQDKVCVAKVQEAGQGHVFDHWDRLSGEQQRELLAQLAGIDFQRLKRLVQQVTRGAADSTEERVLRPPDVVLPDDEIKRDEIELRRTLGDYSLRHGELAFVMAAGTGVANPEDEPLGMLPVGPVTGKSLFQLQAEKVRALHRHYRVSLRCLIFCHPVQLDTIAAFFKKHNYFGLNCSDIQFCPEELLPVVNRRGKLLLAGPSEVAMGTVGQGGILLQLIEEERLKSLERSGVKHVLFFQADNPLVRLGEPTFLGLHIKNQANVTSKAVRRKGPEEDLALFCSFNGAVGVVRPGELEEGERNRRQEDGQLEFSAAQIGVHLFSLSFLWRLNQESIKLPVRGVPVATPHVDKRGRVQRPSDPNSIRFQTFPFEVFRAARRATIVDVHRETEYSPITSTSGSNSPQTAQRDLSQLYTRWLREAGAVDPALSPDLEPAVEISPLFALDAEELREKIELPVAPESGAILLGGKP